MTLISRVETFLVAPRWLFVRIETDSGIVGWGEATCEGRSETVRTAVDQLSELLVGRDALRIEDHWQVMTKGSFYRGGPILSSAVSGLDQALWDIAGKRYAAPVHQLLGGPVRDRIRVYGWVGGDEPAEVADHVREQVEAGLTAVKMNASGRMSPVATVAEIDGVIERVAAARRGARAPCGRGGGLPRPVHPRQRQAGRAAARAVPPPLPRGARDPRELAPHRRARPLDHHAGLDGGAALQPPGVPPGPGGRHRGRPAGPVACRRDHRGAQDRRAGRGVRRPAGAALPARAARSRLVPPGRLRDAKLPDPGAEHRDPLQPRGPSSWNHLVDTTPLEFVDGHIERFTGPGLGIDIDEQAVRSADKSGHAWRGPVWRHADGSFAEW